MAFKKLVISSGQVSGASHSDFPILIQPSKMTGWEALTLAEAESIRIYTDEAKTNEVAREVVSADEIHCKVPTLTSSTELYVEYDGIAADYGVATSFGRDAVWGDYKFVAHLETLIDSTGNQTITNSGAVAATGKVGGAYDFDSGDYMTAGTFSTASGAYTWDVWISHGTLSSSTHFIFDSLSGRAALSLRRTGPSGVTVNDSVSFFDGSSWNNTNQAPGVGWHKITLVSSGSGVSIYVDGSSVFSNSASMNSMGSDFGLSANIGDLSISAYAGLLDEAKVTESQRSTDWITTEYNNQNDVASFWGTVTDAGGDPPAPVADTGFFAFM